MTEEEEEAFEEEYGVPVHAGGSPIISRWAMGMALLFVGIAFSTFLLSYFYLRVENAQWPPLGIAEPNLWTTALAALLVLASGAPMLAARRSIRRGDHRGLRVGLGAAIGLAAAGGALQVADVAGLDFDAQAHAYNSMFYTLSGFIFLVAITAIAMAALNVFWSFRGHYTARRHVHVTNTARYWTMAIAVWVIGFGTLYLGPHLT